MRRYEDIKYAAEVEGITKTIEELSDRFLRIEDQSRNQISQNSQLVPYENNNNS